MLTCELESMKTAGSTEAEASDFLHPFLQQVCEYSDDTIEKVRTPFRDLIEQYSGKVDKEVILLKRKLGVGCKVMPLSAGSFVIEEKNASSIISKIQEFQKGKKKPKDLAMPVRAAMDAGVIRRPSFVEFEAVAVLADISKTSFESYTNPVLKPYDDAAFWDMVNTFRHIV